MSIDPGTAAARSRARTRATSRAWGRPIPYCHTVAGQTAAAPRGPRTRSTPSRAQRTRQISRPHASTEHTDGTSIHAHAMRPTRTPRPPLSSRRGRRHHVTHTTASAPCRRPPLSCACGLARVEGIHAQPPSTYQPSLARARGAARGRHTRALSVAPLGPLRCLPRRCVGHCCRRRRRHPPLGSSPLSVAQLKDNAQVVSALESAHESRDVHMYGCC